MRDKCSYPTPVGEILGKTSRRFKLCENLKLYKICDKWKNIAGLAIAAHCEPVRWRGKTLIIRVEHSTWMQELSYLKGQIMARIKEALPGSPIEDIRFEVGKIGRRAHEERQSFSPPLRSLGPHEQGFIDQTISHIRDTEVCTAAKKAMEKYLKRRVTPENT